MIHIYYTKIPNELGQHTFDKLLQSVTLQRQIKISKLFRYEDKVRSLYAELLLGFAYRCTTGQKISNKSLSINNNEYGKPQFNKTEGIFFNLSHSDLYVLCGVGDSDLGVDVEKHQSIDITIAQKYFTSGEYQKILAHKTSEQKVFFDIWTMKESFVKAIGKGLSIALDSFDVSMYDRGEIFSEYEKYTYRGVLLHGMKEGYSWAVCQKCFGAESGISGIHEVSCEEIIEDV